MKNYWLRKHHVNIITIDFVELYKEMETIKECMEKVYVTLANTICGGHKYRIRAGKDAAACFECSCSGFYPPDPSGMRKIRFGRFEIFEDERLDRNVLWIEDEEDVWTKIVFDGLDTLFV
jgi:hypothetical protein